MRLIKDLHAIKGTGGVLTADEAKVIEEIRKRGSRRVRILPRICHEKVKIRKKFVCSPVCERYTKSV